MARISFLCFSSSSSPSFFFLSLLIFDLFSFSPLYLMFFILQVDSPPSLIVATSSPFIYLLRRHSRLAIFLGFTSSSRPTRLLSVSSLSIYFFISSGAPIFPLLSFISYQDRAALSSTSINSLLLFPLQEYKYSFTYLFVFTLFPNKLNSLFIWNL